MSDFDKDEFVLQELKNGNIEGMSPRCKVAIGELANADQGAVIFLIASLYTQISKLEGKVDVLLREAYK